MQAYRNAGMLTEFKNDQRGEACQGGQQARQGDFPVDGRRHMEDVNRKELPHKGEPLDLEQRA